MRSHLWHPESWHPEAVPPRPLISKTLERTDATLAELESHYGPRYAEQLY
jgi:hypothetical protein